MVLRVLGAIEDNKLASRERLKQLLKWKKKEGETYTGVVIVEHMAKDPKYTKLLEKRRDVRWRALSLEKRKDENQVEPSTKDRPGVMSLLIKLHDAVGPKVIGEAMNLMDEKDAGSRINHVRYYGFDDLEKALKSVVNDTKKRSEISKIFP